VGCGLRYSLVEESVSMSDIALVGNNRFEGHHFDDRACRDVGGLRRHHDFDDQSVQKWHRCLGSMDDAVEPIETVRWERVRRVRAAIEAGVYLTEDRLDAAVIGMLRDLDA